MPRRRGQGATGRSQSGSEAKTAPVAADAEAPTNETEKIVVPLARRRDAAAALAAGAGSGEPPAGPPGGTSTALGALLVMAEALTPAGAMELERLLGALLKAPAPTPAQERVAELFALTQLLESELAVSLPRHPIAPVQVSQTDYERTRPTGAPTAETLVERYGGARKDGWAWACRAAWGLLPDGRKTKPGQAWPSTLRGRPRPPRSERDMVIRSIRECAFALLRRPSSNVYVEWLAAQRRRAKAGPGGGQTCEPKRLASIAAVYQQFPQGWPTALAAADVTDSELEQARAAWLPGAAAHGQAQRQAAEPTPAQRLVELNDDQLSALGLDERTRDRLLRKGFGELALSRAAAVARGLGGSLDWLAGADVQPGQPPDPHVRFDPDVFRAVAKQAGVKLEALRLKTKLDVSSWRALTHSKREPLLGHLAGWAATLRCRLEELLITPAKEEGR